MDLARSVEFVRTIARIRSERQLTASVIPEIFQATSADLPSVLALLRQCELLEVGVGEAIDGFCVARSGGALVAAPGLETYGEVGLLRSVAVDPSRRCAGLGTKAVEAVTAMRDGRFGELFSLTTTAATFFERASLSFRAERSSVHCANSRLPGVSSRPAPERRASFASAEGNGRCWPQGPREGTRPAARQMPQTEALASPRVEPSSCARGTPSRSALRNWA